jgi:hypothetical protein
MQGGIARASTASNPDGDRNKGRSHIHDVSQPSEYRYASTGLSGTNSCRAGVASNEEMTPSEETIRICGSVVWAHLPELSPGQHMHFIRQRG